MDKSIFQFVWKHSRRDQITLLLVTLLSFPILYVSLELPKRIINDAISGPGDGVVILGYQFSQVQFLLILCFAFLLTVLVNGLLKMRLNTMKGVLAERLLRRFRYQLLTRVLRFPKPYFRRTSQGELVSMVTSEAEPLGGIMGDMLSHPVMQAGQMLTILTFLFVQSVWFGLAAIALIPLQAWIIPILQRQINLLNKGRIQEVRRLAADIGETAAGVSDIRTSGGLRYTMALFSKRLGTLYDIRFEIYQKKFFMKFVNNFINQLTPFFFYSVGGYLAITGHITVGALVAALAAFKDMSSPWKELLAFYNATQDVQVRWETVTEKFATSPLVDENLFDELPDAPMSLCGDINIHHVTVRDEDGQTILDDISLHIPQGARVAIQTSNENASLAIADLLTRELVPQHGHVTIAGHELNLLHQVTLAHCIGYAHSNAHIMQGTIGDNLLIPFKSRPANGTDVNKGLDTFRRNAEQSGNSIDPFDADWIDPSIAGLSSPDEIKDWWFQLVKAMGMDDFLVRRALDSRLEPGRYQKLTDEIVKLRPEIAKRIAQAGLDDIVCQYHPDRFNQASPLGSNLFYASPTRVLTQMSLSRDTCFVQILKEEGIADDMMTMSVTLVESLISTFGSDVTNHPLFRRLNIDEDLYKRLGNIVDKRREVGDEGLSPDDYALMLTVPFAFSAEQIGPAFSEQLKQQILQIRKSRAQQMVEAFDGLFETLDSKKYMPVMTLMDNALFGRVSSLAGSRKKLIENVIVQVLSEHNLHSMVAVSLYDQEVLAGGDNMPLNFKERVGFSRASIKKPDVLILYNALASYEKAKRNQLRERIGELMPESIIIFIESKFNNPQNYDVFVDLVDGRIDGNTLENGVEDVDARQDLNRKIDIIAKTELFAELDRNQQRLLAFSAQWYKASKDQTIFASNDEADAAYLCVSGSAGLYWRTGNEEPHLVSAVVPGRLIGDLAVILGKPRQLELVAAEDSLFLHIGAEELKAVIDNDVKVASSLLRTVSGNLTDFATHVQDMRVYAKERGLDFSEFDKQ